GWAATSNWSVELSMPLGRLVRVSLWVTMIQLVLLALWTQLRWHIGKLAKPTEEIGWPGSCMKDTQTAPPAANIDLCSRRRVGGATHGCQTARGRASHSETIVRAFII